MQSSTGSIHAWHGWCSVPRILAPSPCACALTSGVSTLPIRSHDRQLQPSPRACGSQSMPAGRGSRICWGPCLGEMALGWGIAMRLYPGAGQRPPDSSAPPSTLSVPYSSRRSRITFCELISIRACGWVLLISCDTSTQTPVEVVYRSEAWVAYS